MLTLDTLPRFLLDRGLLPVESILDGDLLVTSAVRRNRNLRVKRSDGPGYLIKQPDDPVFGGHHSLRFEATFYHFCQTEAAAEPIRPVLPTMAFFDPEQTMVGLELLQDAVPLWQYYVRFAPDAFPRPAAAALGRALGTVHRVFCAGGAADDPRLAWTARDVPWILRVHKPGPDLLASLSPANYQTLQIVQQQPGLGAALDAVRAEWTPSGLIHNDIKSDNVLVMDAPGTEPGTAPEVRIVDWELVQAGDPAWDVAGALHDFVLFWINGMSPAESPQAMVETGRFPLPVVQAGVRAFWRGYRDAAGVQGAAANALARRAVRMSAARLIQSAYEMAQMSMQLPVPSVLLLQAAANLLADPESGQVHLYGLFQEVAA